MGFFLWMICCIGVAMGAMCLVWAARGLITWLFEWVGKRKRLPRLVRSVQQWSRYKDIGMLWSIALIVLVLLTVCLGSYVSWDRDQTASSEPASVVAEQVEAPGQAAQKIPEKDETQGWFGKILVKTGEIAYYNRNGIQTVLRILDGDSSDLDQSTGGLRWLGWAASWLIPFLTVSAAVSMLFGFLPKRIKRKKEYLIFPQVEENSLLLAEDMMRSEDEQKNRLVIFLRVDEDRLTPEHKDRLRKLQAKQYKYTEGDLLRIHWKLQRRKLRFFFLSADTELNFTRMQTLLEEVKQENLFANANKNGNRFPWFFRQEDIGAEERQGVFRQELYLLSDAESSPMLIDHLRQGMCTGVGDYERRPEFAHTELRLLDRYRTVMYDLMKEEPLYKTAVCEGQKPRQIRILILGFGRVGKAFYRMAASFCPMMDYETSVTICDEKAQQQWDLLELECPECQYTVKPDVRSMDVMSLKIVDLIKEVEKKEQDFTYIMLSLGDDERNIKVASRLARYYRKKRWENDEDRLPTICVNLENNIKTQYVSEFFKDEVHSVPLHVFGTDNKTFSEKMLINRDLWNAARKLHRGLKEDQNLSFAYWSEYERRSSIACAAHAAWHVESVKKKLKDSTDYDNWYENQAHETIRKVLLEKEHERWVNYSRCEGMQRISLNVAGKMIRNKTHKHHADPIAQLTPCLRKADGLDDLYGKLYPQTDQMNKKRLEEGKSPYRKFTERDRFVISNADRLRRIALEGERDLELKGYPDP